MHGKLSTKKRSQGGQCRRWVLSEGRQRLYSVVQVMQEGMPALWGSKDCQAKQTVSTLTCALFLTQYSKLLLQNKGNNYLKQNFWWTYFLFSADPTFPSYGGWTNKIPRDQSRKVFPLSHHHSSRSSFSACSVPKKLTPKPPASQAFVNWEM